MTAFGTGSITLSGGTVELASISPANIFGWTTLGTIRAYSGTPTLSTNTITLAGTTTFEAASGATLELSGATAITGSAAVVVGGAGTVNVARPFAAATTLTKNGTGTATLSNTANVFSGAAIVNDGTLAVPAFSALGTGSGLTLAAGTLRYTGSTGATLTRTVSGSSVTGGFENDGNSSIVVSTGSISGTGNNVKLGGAGTGQYNTFGLTTVSDTGFTKTGGGRWIVTDGTNRIAATTVSAGTLMAANATGASGDKLLGGSVTVAAGAGIQTGSDNSQLGKNTYTNLTFQGTSVSRSRIRIGGSAVNPTVQMANDLTLPSSGTTTWDLTADVFKTPGTYTLIEFTGAAILTVGQTRLDNNVAVTLPSGRNLTALTYNTPGGGSPNTITVTIS